MDYPRPKLGKSSSRKSSVNTCRLERSRSRPLPVWITSGLPSGSYCVRTAVLSDFMGEKLLWASSLILNRVSIAILVDELSAYAVVESTYPAATIAIRKELTTRRAEAWPTARGILDLCGFLRLSHLCRIFRHIHHSNPEFLSTGGREPLQSSDLVTTKLREVSLFPSCGVRATSRSHELHSHPSISRLH
jgi:hypothetical protein